MIVVRTILFRSLGLAILLVLLSRREGVAARITATDDVRPSLDQLLDANGALNLKTGFNGSLDARGWNMYTDTSGRPHFTRSYTPGRDSPPARPSSEPNDVYWDSRFCGIGFNGAVDALAVSGTTLYVGGSFSDQGRSCAQVNGIAKWDGAHWSDLGGGIKGMYGPGSILAMLVSGSDLYVAGGFSSAGGKPVKSIARWDGSSWSPLGSGIDGAVYSIALAENGTLYAGGVFSQAGGHPANNVAKWDGRDWSALGGGITGSPQAVFALATMGNELYVGGNFTTAGGQPANRIARWDGANWSALGPGVSDNSNGGFVQAITVNGGDVYVGGYFYTAGQAHVSNLAKWSGSAWSDVAGGVDSYVRAIRFDGSSMYVGGDFHQAGNVPAVGIAKLDLNSNTWMALGSGLQYGVHAILINAGVVFTGGEFYKAGDLLTYNFAKWDGKTWSPFGNDGVDRAASALAVSGDNAYLVGEFYAAGTSAAHGFARWNNSIGSWFGTDPQLGDPTEQLSAVAINGDDVYVGGLFTQIGGIKANNIARWNAATQTWYALGEGLDNQVGSMVVNGGDLFVAGGFGTAGGQPAQRFARWDGASWHGYTTGLSYVSAIAANGSQLYIAGPPQNGSGNQSVVLKWDGSQWLRLRGMLNDSVYGMAISGKNLYIVGMFTYAGGTPANHVAKWNGKWFALGSGLGTNNGILFANAVAVKDGRVYVGGRFDTAGGIAVNNIAMWHGNQWSALGSGLGGMSYGANVFAFGFSGTDLLVTGEFVLAGEKVSHWFGIWHDPYPTKPVLQSPANDADLTTSQPRLNWTDARNATFYRIQLRQGGTKGTLVIDTTQPQSSYKTPVLEAGGMLYYWRVRACNSIGCSPWTQYSRFSVS